MSEAVSDSTVLIFLAKLKKLDTLSNIYRKIVIPEKVREEVVGEGKKRGEKDAHLVERKIEEGLIEVKETGVDKEVQEFNLGSGEAEALSLAKRLDDDLLADDESAREAARILEIKARGSLYFLAEALRSCDLNFDEYLESLEKLTEEGFYMDEAVYMEAVRRGRKIAKKKSD